MGHTMWRRERAVDVVGCICCGVYLPMLLLLLLLVLLLLLAGLPWEAKAVGSSADIRRVGS